MAQKPSPVNSPFVRKPGSGRSERFINILTGEEVSRYRRDQVLLHGPRGHLNARAQARATPEAERLSRPARGRPGHRLKGASLRRLSPLVKHDTGATRAGRQVYGGENAEEYNEILKFLQKNKKILDIGVGVKYSSSLHPVWIQLQYFPDQVINGYQAVSAANQMEFVRKTKYKFAADEFEYFIFNVRFKMDIMRPATRKPKAKRKAKRKAKSKPLTPAKPSRRRKSKPSGRLASYD